MRYEGQPSGDPKVRGGGSGFSGAMPIYVLGKLPGRFAQASQALLCRLPSPRPGECHNTLRALVSYGHELKWGTAAGTTTGLD